MVGRLQEESDSSAGERRGDPRRRDAGLGEYRGISEEQVSAEVNGADRDRPDRRPKQATDQPAAVLTGRG